MGCAYNNLKALTVNTVFNKLLAYASCSLPLSSKYARRRATDFFHLKEEVKKNKLLQMIYTPHHTQ